MNWLKRWLGTGQLGPLLERMATSLDSVGEAVSSNESALQKGLRRLSMAQKQQNETLERLVQESAKTRFALEAHQGLALSHQQLLRTLDNLAKIELGVGQPSSTREVIAPLIDQTRSDLLADCDIAPVAQVGKPYPDHACEVVGSAEHHDWPPGTVVEILQQGYQTANGDMLRAAKVMVCSATDAKAHKISGASHLEDITGVK